MPQAESRFDCKYQVIDCSKRITIVPLGDVHFNSPMFAKDVFDAWCIEYKARLKKGEDIYFIGTGDYLDTLGSGERKALVNLHESSQEWLDEQVAGDIERLAKKLEFSKGRWLGMLTGNHNYITGDGLTTTQLLAQKLNAEALGVCAAIRLVLRTPPDRESKESFYYDIWAHHGKGGGQLAGATLNVLERWANGLDCDLVLMGHDHKKTPAKIERMSIVGSGEYTRIRAKTITVCRTGGFLKGYEAGKTSYIARNAYRPCVLGTAEINLQITRRGRKESREWAVETKVTI